MSLIEDLKEERAKEAAKLAKMTEERDCLREAINAPSSTPADVEALLSAKRRLTDDIDRCLRTIHAYDLVLARKVH